MNKTKQPAIYQVLQELYLAGGLQDIRGLWTLKRKPLKQWCETCGKQICEVIYALICDQNPQQILKTFHKKEVK